MPIYDFQCQDCQGVFEKWMSMAEVKGKAPCPECGGPGVKLISAPGLVFKGPGFYKTDSRVPAKSLD